MVDCRVCQHLEHIVLLACNEADEVVLVFFFFFFQAEDGIRDYKVTGVQTCALPICEGLRRGTQGGARRRTASWRAPSALLPSIRESRHLRSVGAPVAPQRRRLAGKPHTGSRCADRSRPRWRCLQPSAGTRRGARARQAPKHGYCTPTETEPAAPARAGSRRPGTTPRLLAPGPWTDRKSTRLNSSHLVISYAVFCLKKKKTRKPTPALSDPSRRSSRRSGGRVH